MLLLGSDPLTRFLNAAAGKPFRWGEFDCLLWLADLIRERRGVDPAVHLRGSYSTMLQAARLVRNAGGMVALVDANVREAGVGRGDKPRRGDIAIVPVVGPGTEPFGGVAGGILLDGTVALFCQDGLLFNRLSDAPPVATWAV